MSLPHKEFALDEILINPKGNKAIMKYLNNEWVHRIDEN